MKKVAKLTLLISFAITLQNQFWGNLNFANNISTIFKVALILAVFELLLKPIIKFLLIPINILTLGTFRIVINTLGFYLAAFLLTDFTVNSINTSSFDWQGLMIPAMSFNGFWAHLVNSVSTNFFVHIFKIIIKTKREKK